MWPVWITLAIATVGCSILSAHAQSTSKILSEGYVYSNGRFTAVTLPSYPNVFPTGINDQGDIAGIADPGCFVRQSNQSVRWVTIPGATKCGGAHINNAGTMVGWYLSPATSGFSATASGIIAPISVAGCFSTDLASINTKGDIVGTCWRAGNEGAGLLLRSGTPTIINAPRASTTSLKGINDKGDIVGTYYDANGLNSFLYRGGQFTKIDVPGCQVSIEVHGISNREQIVGTCAPPYQSNSPTSITFVLDSASWSSTFVTAPSKLIFLPRAINAQTEMVGVLQPY